MPALRPARGSGLSVVEALSLAHRIRMLVAGNCQIWGLLALTFHCKHSGHRPGSS